MKTISLWLSAIVLTLVLSVASYAQPTHPTVKPKHYRTSHKVGTRKARTTVKKAKTALSTAPAPTVAPAASAPVPAGTSASTVAVATPATPPTTATPTEATAVAAPVAAAVPAPAQPTTDTTAAVFDKVLSAQAQGNKAATVQALEASSTALDTEAQTSTGTFKNKLSGQASGLKKLIPLVQSGMLSGGMLQKAISMAKLAFAANKIEGLMGQGSLLSSLGGLTSNMNLLQGGMAALGGGSSSAGGSLISGALSGLSSLGQGGAVATAAEPGVRTQLTNVLGMVNSSF